VAFVDALPVSPYGKVLKAELKAAIFEIPSAERSIRERLRVASA
jgi:hypothetical protein